MRTSLTDFFDLFRVGGIGDAKKRPRYSDDIQLTSIVQDLIPRGGGVGGGFTPGWQNPVPVLVQHAVRIFQSQVAGERTRFEMQALATGGGLWITGVFTATNAAIAHFFTTGSLLGGFTTFVPTEANSSAYGDGVAPTAVLQTGTTLVPAPGQAERYDYGDGPGKLTPDRFIGNTGYRYIGPGRVFVVQLNTANVPEFFGVDWIEIP